MSTESTITWDPASCTSNQPSFQACKDQSDFVGRSDALDPPSKSRRIHPRGGDIMDDSSPSMPVEVLGTNDLIPSSSQSRRMSASSDSHFMELRRSVMGPGLLANRHKISASCAPYWSTNSRTMNEGKLCWTAIRCTVSVGH